MLLRRGAFKLCLHCVDFISAGPLLPSVVGGRWLSLLLVHFVLRLECAHCTLYIHTTNLIRLVLCLSWHYLLWILENPVEVHCSEFNWDFASLELLEISHWVLREVNHWLLVVLSVHHHSCALC